MRVPGFIQTPFAFSGDKATIPVATQPGGQVSFTQGWGPDYAKDLDTDPTAKAIDRQQTNQLMYVMSTLIQRWQSETFPEWIDAAANGGAPYPYPIGAVVRVVNGTSWVLRVSNVDGNTTTPDAGASTASWGAVSFTDAVTRTDTAMQTMAGPLTVGAGSLLGGATPAQSVNDKRLASMEWITAGKASVTGGSDGRPNPGNVNRFTLPKWFSSDGTKTYTRVFGIANLPKLGVSAEGLHVWGVNGIPISPSVDIALANVAMLATHNVDSGSTVPGLGVRCRMPDYRNLSIAATSNIDLSPTLPVSWSVEWWA
jgi:hypothetical protein